MENKLLLSIIVPVYNAAEYLPGCLNSMLDQELNKSDYEIVCVDDGSTDDSLEILNDYAKRFPNIKPYHKENGGVSSTRNFAIEKSQGKYLMFVDSDDFICRNSIKPIIDEAIKKDLDIVEWGFRSVWVSYEGQMLKEPSEIVLKTVKVNPLKASNTLWKLMVKKDIIINHNIKFDTRIHYGEDALFSFLVHLHAINGKMMKTPARVYNYRIVENSLTHKADPNSADWAIKRIENISFRIEDCESVRQDCISKTQEKILLKRIRLYVSDIVRNTLKLDDETAKANLDTLREKSIYPYPAFSCVQEYDSQDNSLTYYKKGRFKLLLKHHVRSIIYNLLIILLSKPITYKLVRKIK